MLVVVLGGAAWSWPRLVSSSAVLAEGFDAPQTELRATLQNNLPAGGHGPGLERQRSHHQKQQSVQISKTAGKTV